MMKHEVALNKSGIKFPGITTTLAAVDASVLGCVISVSMWYLPYLTLPYLTLPHLTSPRLTSPHLTSPHLTSPHLTSPHLTSPHLTSPHLTLPYLTLPYLTLPYLTLPYLTLPYRTLPYVCSSSSMSFLDIKGITKRAALVNEYVTAMKTVK